MILRSLMPVVVGFVSIAVASTSTGGVDPLPAPLGCKSISQFDECVLPAAQAILCDHNDAACICSGYRINRGCFTLYCPDQKWRYEERGTACGPIPTTPAQIASAATTKAATANSNPAPKSKDAAADLGMGESSAGARSPTVEMEKVIFMFAAAALAAFCCAL